MRPRADIEPKQQGVGIALAGSFGSRRGRGATTLLPDHGRRSARATVLGQLPVEIVHHFGQSLYYTGVLIGQISGLADIAVEVVQ